ncbi:MAG TPA: helix-turn-helix domain-containing protein [Rubrivivax sp.]|nr:helix-turn-helix domain-containing protein [Rubrivivax sp.]
MTATREPVALALAPEPAGSAPLPGPGWRLDAHAVDVDDIARSQRDWRLEYSQLSAGAYVGGLQHIQLEGLRLVSEWANRGLRQRGQLDTRTVGFAIALSASGYARFHGVVAADESIMIGGGDDIDLTLAPDSLHVGIVVERGLLTELWRGSELQPWSQGRASQLCVQARPGHAAALVQTQLQRMRELSEDNAALRDAARLRRLRDALLLAWLEALPERLDAAAPKAARERRALVQRVCELAAPAPEPPPTLLEVCRRIGISPRKLEYCFQDVLGMSPRQYLRAARLNGVRRELRRGCDSRSIADVASHWGFWHMSDFAADYKRLFGELPSQTDRRARRTASLI